jgi:hypothetical protein
MANTESGAAPRGAEPPVQSATVQPPVTINPREISKIWQLITLLAPVLLTAWLTFSFNNTEKKISATMDSQTQRLDSQLRVSEELFKRQVDTYDKLYGQLVSLQAKLQDQTTANSKETADLLTELSQARAMNELHMSKTVSEQMREAWRAAVQHPDTLAVKIAAVEDQMKSELESKMQEPAKSGHAIP